MKIILRWVFTLLLNHLLLFYYDLDKTELLQIAWETHMHGQKCEKLN